MIIHFVETKKGQCTRFRFGFGFIFIEIQSLICINPFVLIHFFKKMDPKCLFFLLCFNISPIICLIKFGDLAVNDIIIGDSLNDDTTYFENKNQKKDEIEQGEKQGEQGEQGEEQYVFWEDETKILLLNYTHIRHGSIMNTLTCYCSQKEIEIGGILTHVGFVYSLHRIDYSLNFLEIRHEKHLDFFVHEPDNLPNLGRFLMYAKDFFDLKG